MARKVDFTRDREGRLRVYLKDNRRASMLDAAKFLGTTTAEIESILSPGKPAGLPRCEAPNCTRDAHFGFNTNLRRKGIWLCATHREQASHDEEAQEARG